jgi:hypothetical protein
VGFGKQYRVIKMTFIEYIEKEHEDSIERIKENGIAARKAHENFMRAI